MERGHHACGSGYVTKTHLPQPHGVRPAALADPRHRCFSRARRFPHAHAAMPELQVVGRMLGVKSSRTPYENMLEVLSYVISFASYYIFVWFAKVGSPPNGRAAAARRLCCVPSSSVACVTRASQRSMASPQYRQDSSSWSRLVFTCVGEREEISYRRALGHPQDHERVSRASPLVTDPTDRRSPTYQHTRHALGC